MTMHWIDWGILGALVALICATAYSTRKYTRSVADFLAASRCAGKYILGVSDGIAALGAVTVVALFEMHYKAGFTAVWWNMMILLAGVVIAASGWVQYRFRETRAMTMAQFFEMRYSRNFRIFAGLLAFLAGTINFAIFPAVGARFFQYFCGFPNHYVWTVLGFPIDPVYAAIMLVLLGISLLFTLTGGQIAVLVTDFIQGSFTNVVFLVISVYLLFSLDWHVLGEALSIAEDTARQEAAANSAGVVRDNFSLIDPLRSGDVENFDVFYFLIAVFGLFFTWIGWQGNQGYYTSAKSAHDARMGRVVGNLRPVIQTLTIVLLPVCAIMLLHHPNYAAQREQIMATLGTIGSEQLQSQLRVTVAIQTLLPVGVAGCLAAVMFAAFVSTHDTYLHAWGSIFVQDVALPFRNLLLKRTAPLGARAHLWLLRGAIAGVAVFIFLFSLFFSQQQDIFMYFALTGTVYLGWVGACIIGGLYWRKGTSAGAWAAAFVGAGLAVIGWYMTYFWEQSQAIMQHLVPGLWDWAVSVRPDLAGAKCPITAQWLWFGTMIGSALVYALVSLISIYIFRAQACNLDQVLHRGEYARDDDKMGLPPTGLQAFSAKGFSIPDKILFYGSLAYSILTLAVFVIGTVYAVFVGVSEDGWMRFWWIYCIVMVVLTAVFSVWLLIGGAYDLRELYRLLSNIKRSALDDGTVVGNRNLDDLDESELQCQEIEGKE